MPCFSGAKARETEQLLRTYLGQAQILADTFRSELAEGLALSTFLKTAKVVRNKKYDYSFVDRGLIEPVGVAGSLLSWSTQVNSLVMVVDVGAGTSDFSLFRLSFNPETEKSVALQAEGSARGVQQAGNHLDRLLRGLILKKAGVDSSNPHWIRFCWDIDRRIREYKETLFSEGTVIVILNDVGDIEITLNEFMSLDEVQKLGELLRKAIRDSLQSVDTSWTGWVTSTPHRYLTVVLTGGGADLPMVKRLAEENVLVGKNTVRVKGANRFPKWLADTYPELEDEYPRIAVSLGGARRHMIKSSESLITGGDIPTPPDLGGYYTKGI